MGNRGLAILERILREKNSQFEGEREQLCELRGGILGNGRVFELPSIDPPIVGNPKPTIQIDCEPNSHILGTHITHWLIP